MRPLLRAVPVAFVLLCFTVGPSAAQPVFPAGRLFGGLSLNGQNAPAGTVVVAYVGTAVCGVTAGPGVYDGVQYFLDLDGGQPACATPGYPVTFTVAGVVAAEVAFVPAIPGTAVAVNLTASGGLPYPFQVPPPPPSAPPPSTAPGSHGHCQRERAAGRSCHHR